MHQKNVDILLVEDNMSDADLAMRVLKKHNPLNNIVHVEDGQQALDYIFAEGEWSQRSNAELPKVIFLDLKMPKVGGIEVLQKLKSNENTKTIPVVVFTSSKQEPDIRRSYELGVNSYVVKPLVFAEFVDAVANLGIYWLVVNHHSTLGHEI